MNKQAAIFGLSALIAMCNTPYAMDIKHGALISHKEWNTGHFTSSFRDLKNDMQHASISSEMNKLMWANSYPEFVEATDTLSNTQLYGTTTTDTLIDSNSNLTISNMSDTSQTYDIITRICVQNPSFPVQCANAYDVVKLESQGIATISRSDSMSILLPTAGDYTTIAGVAISKEGHTAQYAFWTTGNLTVSADTTVSN